MLISQSRCTAQFCIVCGSKWKTCECPWFTEDPLTDGDRLLADAGDVFDENGAGPSRALRERDEFGRISLRPRPRNHQDETRNRELQVRGDEQLARNLQIYGDEDDRDSEDDDDDDDDDGDDYEVHHDSGKRNGARPPGGLHYRQREHEKRGKGHAHAAPGRHSTPPQAESRYEKPPRGYERGPGKYIEVPRARQRDRASRPGSMERRLASRLSEHRPPPPGPMGPPATPPMSHPAYMMGPNLSVPPTISPVGMGIPMGMPPPLQQSVSMPPTVPMMPPYPFMETSQQSFSEARLGNITANPVSIASLASLVKLVKLVRLVRLEVRGNTVKLSTILDRPQGPGRHQASITIRRFIMTWMTSPYHGRVWKERRGDDGSQKRPPDNGHATMLTWTMT